MSSKKRARPSPKPPTDVDSIPFVGDGAERLLRVLGLQNADGSVSADNRRKLKQVSHLIPLLVAHMNPASAASTLELVDLNCGNAYLAFMVHASLTASGASVHVLGVDRAPERIDACRRKARALGYVGMDFEVGAAADYPLPESPFAVMSLHGCDTATDDAVVRGVERGAEHILAVPCCHREVRGYLGNSPAASAFRDDGILAVDYAACLTDALRALWLRAKGYRTEVVEFVSWEHTPRNRLLRARKGLGAAEVAEARRAFMTASDGLATAPAALRAAF